jgi:hypothetical protein
MKVTMMVGLVLDFDDEALDGDLDPREMILNGKVKVLKANMKLTDTETKELIHEGDVTEEIKDVIESK